MTHAVINALIRPLVEPQLPGWLETEWFTTVDELMDMAPRAEIGWFDLWDKGQMATAVAAATRLKWLNSIYAGVDHVPLALLAERGAIYTNGAGINAITIAEWVVMGMLTMAKGYDTIVAAGERGEWLLDSPGKRELFGSKALLLGYGAIGQLVDERLAAFGVEVVKVRRSGGAGVLRPDEWRARLGEFDWVILALPATPETDGMIGAAELAAMKADCVLVNVARGTVVDQDALVAALQGRRLGGAFLDVTEPEPLPADHPLWSTPNTRITMHLSGTAQSRMFQRSAARFLANLERWHRGEPLEHMVDLARGY
ncbi:MAG: D-2-hydroxyacid dehydrogenase [Proteobacteria bacterium]|nr:D-2-hydroxyacid dehydrogenase [Pseudomonadota bacterium]